MIPQLNNKNNSNSIRPNSFCDTVPYDPEIKDIPIAGLEPLTMIDFPGRVATVLFLKGCNWKCRYCHNTSLDSANPVPLGSFESYLKNRAGYIDGVVVSGGEPTIHGSLPGLFRWLRGRGYETCLHTNGSNPDMVKYLLKQRLLDYIAMDVKGTPLNYDTVTGVENSALKAACTMAMIVASGVEHEFRTTMHPDVCTEDDVVNIMHILHNLGAKSYYIQRFIKKGVSDAALLNGPDVVEVPEHLIELGRRLFDTFDVR